MNRHDHLCPAACECGACAPICECALITRTRAEERSTDTRDLAIAALRDQVATLQTETIRLEHLLDSLRRLPRPVDAPSSRTGTPQSHGNPEPLDGCQSDM